jgi:alpha-methylacyl-CoA racemase
MVTTPTPAPGAEPAGGPLHGIRVLDMSALGPGPFCSMLLADFGADVITVERPATPSFDPARFFSRGKRSTVVDLRAPGGSEVIARLAEHVDVLLESNRPGTMERRGLGPDVLCARNPRLVYARLTGWGQDGPYRDRAGHDINYIGVSGALGVVGAPDSAAPVPPLALVGDMAGGSMFAALGIMMALFERTVTGRGQVVDSAIVDGSALLNAPQLAELGAGMWSGRGRHILSGAAPFYGVYRCSDGGWFAVGAIEPKFYARFLTALGLDDVDPAVQMDPATWAGLRQRVAGTFGSKPRSHWTAVFADIDGCGTPVLELDEIAEDPHLRARGTIVSHGDRPVAAPAPRLSRSPGRLRPAPAGRGADTRAVLGEAGFSADEVARLAADGTIVLGG